MTEDEARALIRERLAEKMSGKPFNPENITSAIIEIEDELTHVVYPEPEVTTVPGSQRVNIKLFPPQVIGLPIGPKN